MTTPTETAPTENRRLADLADVHGLNGTRYAALGSPAAMASALRRLAGDCPDPDRAYPAGAAGSPTELLAACADAAAAALSVFASALAGIEDRAEAEDRALAAFRRAEAAGEFSSRPGDYRRGGCLPALDDTGTAGQ